MSEQVKVMKSQEQNYQKTIEKLQSQSNSSVTNNDQLKNTDT